MRDNRFSDLLFIVIAIFFTINLVFILFLIFNNFNNSKNTLPPIYQVVYLQQNKSEIPPIIIKFHPLTLQESNLSRLEVEVITPNPNTNTPKSTPLIIPFQKSTPTISLIPKPILLPTSTPLVLSTPKIITNKKFYIVKPTPNVLKNVYCRKGW